jgi:hypothetical protein
MAYDFNGTNQAATSTSAPVTVEPLTIAVWFKSDVANARTAIVSLCNTTGVGSVSQPFWALVEDGTKAGDPICATAFSTNTSFSEATSTSGFTVGTWHHGCAVFASLSSRTIYLDGGSSATDSTLLSARSQTIDKTAIGCLGRSTNAAFYNGQIAEVGIWNASLTAAEIASLAKGMTCDKIRPQNLVFYAPLVRDLIDQKGGLTITNNNAATVANHPRVYA